jgi:hypothetical protein
MRLMMPKKSEEKYYGNGNAEQPQQHAFAKVHWKPPCYDRFENMLLTKWFHFAEHARLNRKVHAGWLACRLV